MAVQALEMGAVALASDFMSAEAVFVVVFGIMCSATDVALDGVLAQCAYP
jgi:hypothetical protein